MAGPTPLMRGRLVAGTHLAIGAVLLTRPRLVAAPGWVVRVLGARGVIQGALTMAMPTRRALAAGALVDATHAASMVPVIACSPRHRRAAARSALLAAAMAAAALAAQ